MKFKFNKLGPVSSGQVELGDLTVLCGDNNTGKTYVAYAIYGYCRLRYDRVISRRDISEEHPLLTNEYMKKLFDSGEVSIPIDVDSLVKLGMLYMRDYNKRLNLEMRSVFAGLPGSFPGDCVEIMMSQRQVKTWIKSRLDRISGHKPIRDLELEYGNGHLTFTIKSEKRLGFYSGNLDSAKYFLVKNLNKLLFKPPLRNSFILTSERLGISLFYKDLDASRNALIEALQKLDEKDRHANDVDILVESGSRYAKPISDEINFARDLYDVSKKKSELLKGRQPGLHGKVVKMTNASYRPDKNHVNLVSSSRGDKRFVIPLHMASASSRELAHLFFYLKNEARVSDLLIFDEPESHLSTKNQRLLARLLCSSVNAGIKVLLTTHSDILIKEINNIIILSEVQHRDETFNRKCSAYKEMEGLRPEKVKAYEFASRTIRPMKIDSSGINIGYFDHEPAKLAEDRNNLSKLIREQTIRFLS